MVEDSAGAAAYGSASCPSCGGMPRFDIASQECRCPSCGGSVEPRLSHAVAHAACPSCGARFMPDPSYSTRTCPYCDRDLVEVAPREGMLPVSSVVPFKVGPERARSALEAEIASFKPLSAGHPDGWVLSMNPVYVPVAVADADIEAVYRGNVENEGVSRDITVRASLRGLAADASAVMPNTAMNALCDSGALSGERPYRLGLVIGFPVEVPDDLSAARRRLESHAWRILDEVVAGACVRALDIYKGMPVPGSRLDVPVSRLVAFPVYHASYACGGEVYYAAVSGLDARVACRRPPANPVPAYAAYGLHAALCAALAILASAGACAVAGDPVPGAAAIVFPGVFCTAYAFTVGVLKRWAARRYRLDRSPGATYGVPDDSNEYAIYRDGPVTSPCGFRYRFREIMAKRGGDPWGTDRWAVGPRLLSTRSGPVDIAGGARRTLEAVAGTFNPRRGRGEGRDGQ